MHAQSAVIVSTNSVSRSSTRIGIYHPLCTPVRSSNLLIEWSPDAHKECRFGGTRGTSTSIRELPRKESANEECRFLDASNKPAHTHQEQNSRKNKFRSRAERGTEDLSRGIDWKRRPCSWGSKAGAACIALYVQSRLCRTAERTALLNGVLTS